LVPHVTINTPPIIPLYPIIPPVENPDKWWKKHQKRKGFRFVEIFSFDTYKGFEVPYRYGKGGEKAINPPFRFMEIFSFDTKKGTNVPERFGKGGRGGIVANPNNLFLEGPGKPIEKVISKGDIAGQMKWYKSGPRLLNDLKSPKDIVIPKDKNIHPMHPINMPKNPFMLGKKGK